MNEKLFGRKLKEIFWKKENVIQFFPNVTKSHQGSTMSGPVGQLFSKLSAVVASPASSVQNHKIVIDRKTIEKTWKYMDKVCCV